MVKKGYCAWLDDDVVERFRSFILAKCGFNLHSFGNELERAMEHYMSDPKMASTHTFAHDIVSTKVTGRLEKVFLILKRNCIEPPTDDDLRQVIGDVAGHDDRTFWKYRRLLLANGYLTIKKRELRRVALPGGNDKGMQFFTYDWGPRAKKTKEISP